MIPQLDWRLAVEKLTLVYIFSHLTPFIIDFIYENSIIHSDDLTRGIIKVTIRLHCLFSVISMSTIFMKADQSVKYFQGYRRSL